MIDLTRYVGIPYVPGGSSFEKVDCWGLVCLFYRLEFGIELPRYYDEADPQEIQEVAHIMYGTELGSGRWEKVPRGEEQLGDVVDIMFFNVFHVGLFVPQRRLLHAMVKTKTVIEDLHRPQWQKSIRGCYRHVR